MRPGGTRDGQDAAVLYHGVELSAARQAARVWAADPDRYPALTPRETDFLRASDRAATRGRWGRRTLATALVVLLLAALAGAGLAVRSARNTADQQRTTDLSGRLAAQSTALEALDPLTASLLAGAAWRIAPTAQARYSLLESLAQPVRGILAAEPGVVTALAYGPGRHHPGGRVLRRRHRVVGPRLAQPGQHGQLGRGGKHTGVHRRRQDPGCRRPRCYRHVEPGQSGHDRRAPAGRGPAGSAVAFSPDGKIVATGGEDGNIRLWSAATSQEIGAPMSSDLKPVDAVAFSPDGATVAAASTDGTVQLWDVATEQEAGAAMVASSAAVNALTFSSGGTILATGDADGNIRLWTVATQTPAGAVMATGTALAALTFNASGTTLATAGSDGSTELWQVATQHQTGPPLTAPGSGGVSAVAFGPAAGQAGADGLATGNGDGTVRLWNPAGFHQASAPLAIGAPETPAAAAGHAPTVLSADGDILAVGGARGTVRLWNLATRQPAGVPARRRPGHQRPGRQPRRTDGGRDGSWRAAMDDSDRPPDREPAPCGRRRRPGGLQPGRLIAGDDRERR